MTTSLGTKIRALRKEKGLTLDRLAEASESSKSYIWELENKNPPRPSADKLCRISAALGVTLEYLMAEDTTPPDAEVEDQAFFRDYKALNADTKKQLRDILKVIKGKNG